MLHNVQQVFASQAAFAAILEDESVLTWGDPQCGGDSSEVEDQLRNVQVVQAREIALMPSGQMARLSPVVNQKAGTSAEERAADQGYRYSICCYLVRWISCSMGHSREITVVTALKSKIKSDWCSFLLITSSCSILHRDKLLRSKQAVDPLV